MGVEKKDTGKGEINWEWWQNGKDEGTGGTRYKSGGDDYFEGSVRIYTLVILSFESPIITCYLLSFENVY